MSKVLEEVARLQGKVDARRAWLEGLGGHDSDGPWIWGGWIEEAV